MGRTWLSGSSVPRVINRGPLVLTQPTDGLESLRKLHHTCSALEGMAGKLLSTESIDQVSYT